MLARIHRLMAAPLTPKTPVEAQIRLEQLRALAEANRKSIPVGLIALLLAWLDLQWASPAVVLSWFLPQLAAHVCMIAGSRAFLARKHVPKDAAKETLRMMLVSLPLVLLWPTMAWCIWVAGDAVNNAFVIIFLLASMAAAVLQIGFVRQVALPGLVLYLPLLAFFRLRGPTLVTLLDPVLQVGGGVLILRLCLSFEESFRMLALKSIEKEALASELTQTAAELREARDQAEEASASKSKFLAHMSHELRTPLNAIIGFSDVIRNAMYGPVSPPRYGAYIEDIHRSGLHLLNLINNLLDLAKIESGRHELQESDIDLDAVSTGALRLVQMQARQSGIVLLTEIEPRLKLRADERAVTQILTNLLSNAVKFTESGGEVTIFAHEIAGGAIALGVKDTGGGMEPEDVQRALQPFVQVSHFATVEGWGSGLGLPLVKALTELHGGSFHIESHRGIGTCAWCEFPADRSVQAALPPKAPQPAFA